MLSSFLSGAVFATCIAIALQFLRLWRRTRDPLFGFFLAAFLVLGAERLVLTSVNVDNEFAPYVYLVRLVSFVIIIAGIWNKNRGR